MKIFFYLLYLLLFRGSDPMMTANSGGMVASPHSHPGMIQHQQTPIGPPGQSPLARYMMAQSPQGGVYRPQMSPMNMMSKKKKAKYFLF
jgi:hypothetical protein